MDWVTLGQRVTSFIGKYKYALLVAGVGLLLMLLPTREKHHSVTEPVTAAVMEESITEQLCEILGQIHGVGRVRVMITEQSGPETVYQTDEDKTEDTDTGSVRRETVIISGSSGESGLVKSITPPVYLGAIIVCQGADDPTVRLSVAKAVSAVTGISTDRISVLKMK